MEPEGIVPPKRKREGPVVGKSYGLSPKDRIGGHDSLCQIIGVNELDYWRKAADSSGFMLQEIAHSGGNTSKGHKLGRGRIEIKITPNQNNPDSHTDFSIFWREMDKIRKKEDKKD